MILSNKTVLITGGTGSLGKNLVRRILSCELGKPQKIIVFSRDEDKQYAMRLEWKNIKVATDDVTYHNAEDILDFRIGDVKDYGSMAPSIRESDIIIHAAALKQVPVCEYFPFESVKTNLLGAQNIIRAIGESNAKVETVIAISSDKAAKPVNVYGMCKAIQERLIIEANLRCPDTRFVCARYGNVAASRGSVILLFQERIRNKLPLPITTREMTRFLLTLDDATTIVFDALKHAEPGDTYVPDVFSTKITDLAEVMIGNRKLKTEIIGIRPGEKTHEILITEEEIARTVKKGNYYVIKPILPELRSRAPGKPALTKEFSSADRIIDKEQLKRFLKKEGLLN